MVLCGNVAAHTTDSPCLFSAVAAASDASAAHAEEDDALLDA